MDSRDNAERIMPRCGHGMKWPTLVIYATLLYSHVQTNKWYCNQDSMVQNSIQNFFSHFKFYYL